MFVSYADDFAVTAKHIREEIFPKMREVLSNTGKLNLKTAAVDSFGISERLLTDQVHASPEFSNDVDYKVEGGWLVSKKFEQQQSVAQVEQIRQQEVPCSLDELATKLGLGNLQQEHYRMMTMIKERNLGQIYQGKLFLPREYLEKAKEKVVNLYKNNQYLELRELDSLYIGDHAKLQVKQISDIIGDDQFTRLPQILIKNELVKKIVDEMKKLVDESGFCSIDDVRDADPLFSAPVQKLVSKKGQLWQELLIQAKEIVQAAGLLNSVAINSPDEDEIAFICSRKMFDDLVGLFKDASEKLAIERVKKGKKPAALEVQLQRTSSSKEASTGGGGGGKKKGKGK